jgi:hypothetical protein
MSRDWNKGRTYFSKAWKVVLERLTNRFYKPEKEEIGPIARGELGLLTLKPRATAASWKWLVVGGCCWIISECLPGKAAEAAENERINLSLSPIK